MPAARREQVTDLDLVILDWEEVEPPPVNLSHVLQALGPQLPRLQSLGAAWCSVPEWEVRPGECDQELAVVLAAAFPHLQALTLDVFTAQPCSLATHMGPRLARLELTAGCHYQSPSHELLAALPHLTGLKSLMLKYFEFSRGWREPDRASFGWDLVWLLDALPPALESLHLFHPELVNHPDRKMEGARESQLELVLRAGAVQVLRVGWTLLFSDLQLLHSLLTSSKLARLAQRLPLLQLGGLHVSVRPGRFALAHQYERWDVGRLQLDEGTSAEDMAALVQQCRPEEVACGGCVVRLRGSGPPPTIHDFLPRWALDLGAIWARWGGAVGCGRPAPGVAEAVAARGLRLETAEGEEATAVALGALRRGVADVLRAAEAGEQQDERTGGLQYDGVAFSCDLLLLVGPFLRMLGPEAALEAWLRGLCDQARGGQPAPPAGELLIQQYVQLALPHEGGGGATFGAEPAEASPGASDAAGEAAGVAGAGADAALLLACNPSSGLQQVLAGVCAPCPRGSLLQGGAPGLKVLRLAGKRISAELHDAYLSPVGGIWRGPARYVATHGGPALCTSRLQTW